MTKKLFHGFLLVLGLAAFAALFLEIGLAVTATWHQGSPKKTVLVNAGPYPLTVRFYQYPANAGYAMPFSIETTEQVSYLVVTEPTKTGNATPIRASLTPDSRNDKMTQGVAEITVRGEWAVHISVNGNKGHGEAIIPIQAEVPPILPEWAAWPLGIVPIIGIFFFLRFRTSRKPVAQQT